MDFLQTIEQGAVTAWNDFLTGIKWLNTEAQTIAANVEKVDPAIQQQLQTVLTDGETAAGILLSASTGGMSNIVAGGAVDAETLLANYLSGAFGGNPLEQELSATTVKTVQDAATTLQAALPVAAAKLLSAISAAANPAPAAVQVQTGT